MPDETKDERRRRQNRESQRRFRNRHKKEHQNSASTNDQVAALASGTSPQSSFDVLQSGFMGPISDNVAFATSTPHFPELWNDDRLLPLGNLPNTNYSIASPNAPIDEQPSSSVIEYAAPTTSVLNHSLPITSVQGNGASLSCAHLPQPIGITPQSEGHSRPSTEPTCEQAFFAPYTELRRTSETGSQGGTLNLEYLRQQPPPSKPCSASKKKEAAVRPRIHSPLRQLGPSRSRGPRRRRVRKKVDLMIAEIQEVYRVGVFLGLFERDEELQQLLMVVRERFRDLEIRHVRKGSSDESSNCYTSDDDDALV